MQKIYVVGTLKIDIEQPTPFAGIKSQRLWALFAKFEDAERAILESHGDIFEYYYNYALIEETDLLLSESENNQSYVGYTIPKQWWYHIEYSDHERDPEVHKIYSCSAPKCCEKTCNFWVG